MLRTNRLGPLLALIAALAGLAAAAPPRAGAAVTWVVNGRGFGHGVGMSAYGAYGYALHGKGYKFILGHYYEGTSVGTIQGEPVVRVLLETSRADVAFSGATLACGRAVQPGLTYRAHRVGRTVRLLGPGGAMLASCGARLRAAGHGRITIAGLGTYRGALETVPSGGTLNVVNALGVNQYVEGVIPNESPPSWPVAELEAQAIASRSFALTAGVEGAGFDLYSDTRSQVYKGLESEYPRTDRIAEATRGQVVMYRGEVAETLFSACSGGHTESIQYVFGSSIPYLVGVPDPYDYYCPLHKWTLRFSGPQISSRLAAHLDGRLRRVVVTRHGVTPRIVQAKLYGSGGVTTVTGEQLEAALGAYSTWMSFRKVVSGS
jgi:SpoIID/LytB domain protein